MTTVPGAHLDPSGTPEREDSVRLRDGRQLGWAEWGPADGRPVLLFNGAPGSSHACPDVATTHAARVRLLSVDRPGYGMSDPRPGRRVIDWAADVEELLDQRGIASAPIVGWSSGVSFAMGCAVGIPDRVPALALVAGTAALDETWSTERWQSELGVRIAARRADPVQGRVALLERLAWFADDPTGILEEVAGDAPADDPDQRLRRQPAIAAMLDSMFRQAGRQGAVGWVDDAIAETSPWGFPMAAVHCPTSVWIGDRDRFAELGDSERIAAAVPGAILHVEPDMGHQLPVLRWAEILHAIGVTTTLRTDMSAGKASDAQTADGDAPVFAYIAGLPQPQRGIAERVDALAARTIPGLRRAVKWGMAYYGVEDGWCFTSGGFVGHVAVMFMRGTELKPEPPIKPIAQGRNTRGIQLASIDDLDEVQLASWMQQAAAKPFVTAQQRRKAG